jgi:hypothetical protein
MGTAEYLIITDLGHDVGAFVESVRHAISSRLAVIVVDPSTAERLRARGGVVAVVDDELPPGIVAGLDELERLFVAAWNERRRTKTRTGDDLPWDAAGFEPPDP